MLYQQDLQQLIPRMSSPASHLNSSDSSNEDQIYNVDSTLQSRMPNEGLPLATFYGTKNVTSPDSPSKNHRARKLVFSKKHDYELSPVPSPVDCRYDDHHYQPSPSSSPNISDRPQVQQTKKRGRPAGSKNKNPSCTRKSVPKQRKRQVTSSLSTPIATSSQASTSRDPSSPLMELASRSTSTTILPQVPRPQPVAKR